MYKTTWFIKDIIDNTNTKIELVYYHFGKNPMFPSWYMKENHAYEIEMIWHFKLLKTLPLFLKCLTHHYIIK